MLSRKTALGDVLLLTPIIRAIHDQCADMEIYVTTLHPELFDRNPYVRKTGPNPVPGLHMDFSYNLDLAYEREPHKHIVQAYADHVGVRVSDFKPAIYPSDADRKFARDLGDGKFAVVHAGKIPGWPGRNWAPERYVEVAKLLRQRGYTVIAVGSPAAYPVEAAIDLRGKTKLHQLAAVIERCSLFVGADSLPMHLAVAADRPLVGIFGMINPDYRLPPYIPYMLGAAPEEKQCGCRFCHHDLGAPRIRADCFRGADIRCMKVLSVEHVMRCVQLAEEAYARREASNQSKV
jgi:ADP-heptose:LPS heptosyltransferase